MTNQRLNRWAHRCIGELLQKRNEVQILLETDVLMQDESDALIEVLEDAARCLGEYLDDDSK